MSQFRDRTVWFLFALALIIQACDGNPQQRLDKAFDQADLVKLNFIIDGEIEEGIQFTYSTPEEISELRSQLLEWGSGQTECHDEIGKLRLSFEDELLLELPFNVNEECNTAWLNSEGGFAFDDSLASLIINRYEMVRSIKQPAES